MPSLFHAYWYSMVTWANPAEHKAEMGVNWMRIRFKNTYSASDFSSIAPYSTAMGITYSADDLLSFVKDAYSENWDAKATVKNQWLEIQETWVYFLDYFAQFVYWASYSWSYSTTRPLYLWLIIMDTNWNTKVDAYTQGRTCFYLDRLHETVATPIPKGTKLSLWVAYWHSWENVLVAAWITAVRMD